MELWNRVGDYFYRNFKANVFAFLIGLVVFFLFQFIITDIKTDSVMADTISTDVWEIGSSGRPRVDAIDVSSYQDWMTQGDFEKLKSLGVNTAIVKLTEGQTYKNNLDTNEIKFAKNSGMNVDVYHFVRFMNSAGAVLEADNLIAELNKLGLPKSTLIFADIEGAKNSLGTVSNVEQNLKIFWRTLNNSGYSNYAVYTYKDYYARKEVVSTVGESRTWIAQYPYHPNSTSLWNQEFGAWQFSSTATFNGKTVDVSIDYNGLLSNRLVSQESGKKYGQQYINGHWYLFDSVTGTMKTGFQYISNQHKTVYYNSNGQMLYGQQKINGHWYLFDSVTGTMKIGFQYISNQHKTVYYNSNGQMLYGQQKINGHWYLFDSVTGTMKTGFQYISNQHKTVYYNSNGQMLYGQQKINGHWYLFDSVTGTMKTGFQYISNQHKTVYYNSNGQMLYGQQKINGHWYSFDKVTGKKI